AEEPSEGGEALALAAGALRRAPRVADVRLDAAAEPRAFLRREREAGDEEDEEADDEREDERAERARVGGGGEETGGLPLAGARAAHRELRVAAPDSGDGHPQVDDVAWARA